MKEIIGSILQAEEMAAQIVSDATEKAKNIAAKRDLDAENSKAETATLFVEERKKALKDADKKADDKYKEIMLKAQKTAEELKNSVCAKMDGVADLIVSEIVK